jgi:chemotaxis protein histidine kinase CheA
MSELKRLLVRVSRRLFVVALAERFMAGFFYFLIAIVIISIFNKFIYLENFIYYLAAFLFLVLILYSFLTAILSRASLFESAVRTDCEIGLRERLSSAYLLEGDSSEAAAACRKDADNHLRMVEVKKAFPFRVPRIFKWFFVPLILIAAMWLCPWSFDLTGGENLAKIEGKARQDVLKEAEDAEKKIEKIEKENDKLELSKDIRDDMAELKKFLEFMKENPAERKKLFQQAGKLEEKLKDAMKPDKLKSDMGDYDNKTDFTALKSLADSLEKKDMEQAKREWEKITDQLENATDAAKKEMARELNRLSRAVAGKENPTEADKELADALKQLADALEGLSNEQDANEKSRLKDVAREADESVKKALEKLLRDKEALKKLVDAIKKAKQGMSDAGDGNQKQGGNGSPQSGDGDGEEWAIGLPKGQGQAGGQDSQGENEGDGQGSGKGKGKGKRVLVLGDGNGGIPGGKNRPSGNPNPGDGNGQGQGGPGVGDGGIAKEREHDVKYKETLADSPEGTGPTILGPMRKGAGFVDEKDRKAFKQAVEAARSESADAMAREKVPAYMKNVVKGYFEGLDTGIKPGEEEKEPQGETAPASNPGNK